MMCSGTALLLTAVFTCNTVTTLSKKKGLSSIRKDLHVTRKNRLFCDARLEVLVNNNTFLSKQVENDVATGVIYQPWSYDGNIKR